MEVKFLQNTGCLSTDYTALYPRIQNSSIDVLVDRKPERENTKY
jgi:hypothetical protein